MGLTTLDAPRRPLAARLPVYYGWVNVGVAVLAMVATLPARTWGLGLITNGLLTDFALTRGQFAELNLWATLIGAAFCVPAGRLIDKIGARAVFGVVTLALGASVVLMSRATGGTELFVLITLTRGFGQSALSVVSLALVGKWFGRRTGAAMAWWMVGVLVGYIAAELSLGTAAEVYGWRAAWWATGWAILLGVLPAGLLLARSTPEGAGVTPDAPAVEPDDGTAETGLTLTAALLTPLFWVFVSAAALNSVTQAGISLFGMSLIQQRGLGDTAFKYMMAWSSLGALVGTLFAWFGGKKFSLKRMVAVGLVVLLATLVYLPTVTTLAELYADGFLWGASIGLLGVAGAAAWREAFGRPHLGAIQGAAGVVHVLSSAAGPLLMNQCRELTGSYALFFYVAGAGLAVTAAAAWFVPLPARPVQSPTPPAPPEDRP